MTTPAAAWDDALALAEPASLLPQPGAVSLGLRGGFSRAGDERQRAFGLLELGIGFDALAAADRSVISAPGAGGEAAPPAEGREPHPASPARLAAGLSRCADAQPCAGASLAHVSPELARAAVAAALRVLGSGGELRRLDSMATRSRASASLPEVRLGAGTSADESLRLTPTLADPARFTRDGGRDLWFEARLTWRLDSAMFSKDELAIERLKAEHRAERARVSRDVLEALVDWQRAGVALRTEHLLPEERDAALVRGLGAVARLDVATDGWFSRWLERRGAAVAGAPRP